MDCLSSRFTLDDICCPLFYALRLVTDCHRDGDESVDGNYKLELSTTTNMIFPTSQFETFQTKQGFL